MGWIGLYVRRDETLQCDECGAFMTDCSVHLCVDRVKEVNEVQCNKCWDEI